MDKGAFSIADSLVEEFNDRVEQLSRLTNHPGSKGRFIELLLINLLRKYLPKKYDFSSGFYCSINPELNEASQQIDIICYDLRPLRPCFPRYIRYAYHRNQLL